MTENDVQSPLNPDRLYGLLPAYIRLRDSQIPGTPLRALMQVISEQANLIDLNIAQLYDNWFIETCQDWAVPYLGDLIGYESFYPRLPYGDSRPGSFESHVRSRVVTPRRDVANTLRDRRRKGTPGVLRQIAWDVGGWPSQVDENPSSLGVTVSANPTNAVMGNTASVAITKGLAAAQPPAPPVAAKGVGLDFGINDVVLNVWRKQSISVTWTQARSMDHIGPHCYSFHPLGISFPLYAKLDVSLNDADAPIFRAGSEPWRFPGPISRDLLSDNRNNRTVASKNLYGSGQSIEVRCGFWGGFDQKDIVPGEIDHLVPASKIIPVNLSNWNYNAPNGFVGLDPETGRIVFPQGQQPRKVRVSYYYGAPGPVGGGEYERGTLPQAPHVYTVGKGRQGTFDSISGAIDAWADDVQRAANRETPAQIHGVIEIQDSSIYEEEIHVVLRASQQLHIRAMDGCRPVIRVPDHATRSSRCEVHGHTDGRLVLDGIMIAGRGIKIHGDLERVSLIHCTLVPGWDITTAGLPQYPANPSITIDDSVGELFIDHCVLGPIEIHSEKQNPQPLRITARDSIVDAMPRTADGSSQPRRAINSGTSQYRGHAIGCFSRCTILGETWIHTIELAENCIFTQPVNVTRLAAGQMRFCWLAKSSRIPPLVNCQGQDAVTPLPPVFESEMFGKPSYGVLSDDSPIETLHGADDGLELGAFHDQAQWVRMQNLRARIQEYVPVAISARVAAKT